MKANTVLKLIAFFAIILFTTSCSKDDEIEIHNAFALEKYPDLIQGTWKVTRQWITENPWDENGENMEPTVSRIIFSGTKAKVFFNSTIFATAYVFDQKDNCLGSSTNGYSYSGSPIFDVVDGWRIIGYPFCIRENEYQVSLKVKEGTTVGISDNVGGGQIVLWSYDEKNVSRMVIDGGNAHYELRKESSNTNLNQVFKD